MRAPPAPASPARRSTTASAVVQGRLVVVELRREDALVVAEARTCRCPARQAGSTTPSATVWRTDLVVVAVRLQLVGDRHTVQGVARQVGQRRGDGHRRGVGRGHRPGHHSGRRQRPRVTPVASRRRATPLLFSMHACVPHTFRGASRRRATRAATCPHWQHLETSFTRLSQPPANGGRNSTCVPGRHDDGLRITSADRLGRPPAPSTHPRPWPSAHRGGPPGHAYDVGEGGDPLDREDIVRHSRPRLGRPPSSAP